MNGEIQIVRGDYVIATCETVQEAVKIAKEKGITDCQFIYSCEIAYLDEGKLMIQNRISSIAAKEIKEALEG